MARHPHRFAVEPLHVQRPAFEREHLAVEPLPVDTGHQPLALLLADLHAAGAVLDVAVQAQSGFVYGLHVHKTMEASACPPLADVFASEIARPAQMVEDGLYVGGGQHPRAEFVQGLRAQGGGRALFQ